MSRFSRLTSAAFSCRPLTSLASDRRKYLPPEVSNVVRLTCESTAKGNVCNVYLIGTVPYYPKSCPEVRDVMNSVKPQAVFLQLCSSRADEILEEFKDPYDRWLYEKIFSKIFGVSEFQVAFDEANKIGAKVILGDRPKEITEKRCKEKFARIPARQKMEMRLSIMRGPMKPDLHDDHLFEMSTPNPDIEWRRQCCPILAEVYVDERDQYMSAGLLEAAQKHNSVVAA